MGGKEAKISNSNSSRTLIGVDELHDPLSSLDYPMITHTPLVAGSLPIKTLVAIGDGQQVHTFQRGCCIAQS